MGKQKKSETRNKIMDTAKKLFVKKGLDGLKMRDLADEAGVNKGLLHYYFKNKETLFTEVFTDEAAQLYSHINEILQKDLSFESKLNQIVDKYFDMLQKNPGMPIFVMSEMAKNPGFLPDSLQKEIRTTLGLLSAELSKKGDQGPEGTLNFLLSMLSLCIFPFIAKPLLQKAGDFNHEESLGFIVNRKEHIKTILIKSLEL
jgi:AcrR family transcriptional regulator